MGASIAAACNGDRVWVGAGRSPESHRRADLAGMTVLESVEAMVERADVIVSVCPPASAADVAASVADCGFDGLYVDVNAISPARTIEIAQRFARYVDGGIVGPPAAAVGSTRMYVSGDEAQTVADRWAGSILDVRPIEGGIGAASALKMSYAAWTKGSGALLLAVNALAEHFGVAGPLRAEWEMSQPGLVDRSAWTASNALPKAWRFEGEMHEIAATFDHAGLPEGFHLAAAEVYRRMAASGVDGPPDVGQVVGAILRSTPD